MERGQKQQEMAEEQISIGRRGVDLIIIPEGHITAFLCPELKTEIIKQLKLESSIASIRFDFSSCLYMDSTFLGLIVFLAKTARSQGMGRPIVHRVSTECKSLFRTMGMMKMLDFSEEACPHPTNEEKILAGDRLSAGFLYEVHKELSGLSAENEGRFRDLTEELKAVLDSPEALNDLDG